MPFAHQHKQEGVSPPLIHDSDSEYKDHAWTHRNDQTPLDEVIQVLWDDDSQCWPINHLSAEKHLASKANWSESLHPRDLDGRFRSSGNGRQLPSPRRDYFLGDLTPDLVDKFIPPVTHNFKPRGRPVSSGMRLWSRKLQGSMTRALNAVARVHHDGNLPDLDIYRKRLPVGVQGSYLSELDGTPVHLAISKKVQVAEFTELHEIGHFLDAQGLRCFLPNPSPTPPGGGFSSRLDLSRPSSQQDADLVDFHQAITQSQAYQNLRALTQTPTVQDSATGVTYDINQSHAQYLCEPEEIFARAYAQYIAMKSGDALLRKQLASRLKHNGTTAIGGDTPNSYHYPSQWEPKDFEGISLALDNLFENQNWMQSLSAPQSPAPNSARLARKRGASSQQTP